MPADTAYGVRDHIVKEIDYAKQIFEANPRVQIDKLIEPSKRRLPNSSPQKKWARAKRSGPSENPHLVAGQTLCVATRGVIEKMFSTTHCEIEKKRADQPARSLSRESTCYSEVFHSGED